MHCNKDDTGMAGFAGGMSSLLSFRSLLSRLGLLLYSPTGLLILEHLKVFNGKIRKIFSVKARLPTG